ncbi:Ldh family oxidoreductase [candidate division KSB1 bacterium]|nr:Ldh family oxidoreductase [candidate division KSB1 bacterium]RQW04768.1 MAG: Ldh family oxidoreductase [candidate division KSB1 bacterium]
MEKYYYYSLDKLKQFEKAVFAGIGVPEDEAEICADVLNAADRRGIDSHGIGRLKPIYYDRIVAKVQNAVTQFEIERDIAATAVVNGNNGMGFVVAKKAMAMAIAKARTFGIGMVIAKNSTHYGIAAYYPLMAVDHNMIGLTGTNARPSTAPTWGVENMLGTNPLVFAVPTDEPFAFTNDYATSTAQRGKIEQYAREGKSMPPGWVIGRDGKTKTDPDKVLTALISDQAALTPLGGIGEELGGHKGYGYATVVELLSAGLQLGPFLKQLGGVVDGKKTPILLGHFFIAIDVAHFAEVDVVKKQMGDILRALRTSQKATGAERIYTHGEKEYLHSLEREKTGVPLPPVVCSQMSHMRDELDLDFEFEWDFAT